MPRWINMRRETRALTYGDRRTRPQGFWAVLRIMRVGEYSEHWNPSTQEAIGGPKWLYDDFVIRVIDKPGGNLTGSRITLRPDLTILPDAGSEDLHAKSFTVMYDPKLTRAPQVGDVLFEIDKAASVQEPRPPFVAESKFDIINSTPVAGDYGRAEFYVILAKRNQGGY